MKYPWCKHKMILRRRKNVQCMKNTHPLKASYPSRRITSTSINIGVSNVTLEATYFDVITLRSL